MNVEIVWRPSDATSQTLHADLSLTQLTGLIHTLYETTDPEAVVVIPCAVTTGGAVRERMFRVRRILSIQARPGCSQDH